MKPNWIFITLHHPAEIEKKLNIIGFNNYQPISYSSIFLNIIDFTKIRKTNLNFLKQKKSKKNIRSN